MRDLGMLAELFGGELLEEDVLWLPGERFGDVESRLTRALFA